jgi:hypothetical protein
MKIEKILKAIEGLSDEEKQQVADALSGKEEQPVEAVEEVETVETEETPADTPAEATEESAEEQKEDIEEAVEEAVDDTEEKEDMASENAEIPAEEPIPEMSNSEPIEEAEEVQEQEQPLQDEEGGDMPVDYSQIIDGLNAKIMALEAENKQLKAKVEGAFGLTGKPAGFTAVNKLYGDTSDIPPMRK